jgi:hypothetical protein
MRGECDHRDSGHDRESNGRRLTAPAPDASCQDDGACHVPGEHDRQLRRQQSTRPERSGVEPGPGSPEQVPTASEGIAEEPGEQLDAVKRRFRSIATATMIPASAGTAAHATGGPAPVCSARVASQVSTSAQLTGFSP